MVALDTTTKDNSEILGNLRHAPGRQEETFMTGLDQFSLRFEDLFTEEEQLLKQTVARSPDAAELQAEVCRMVMDELDRLSAQPVDP